MKQNEVAWLSGRTIGVLVPTDLGPPELLLFVW